LDGIDLTVSEGSTLRLPGPDGAGKTPWSGSCPLTTADGGDVRPAARDVAGEPEAVPRR